MSTSEGANNKSVPIAVFGAAGRMGRTIIRCLPRFPDLRLVAAVEQPSHEAIGKDAGAVAGVGSLGVAILSDHEQVSAAEVLIDFSFHMAAPKFLETAVRLRKRVVLGTTGLTAEETRMVHEAAKTTAILWSANMSLGVNLLFSLVEQAARVLDENYDVEIIETHHRHKRDAPSGTALKLAEIIARSRNQSLASVVSYGRAGNVGERPRGQIGIHAVRAGDVVGEHAISFAAEGELLQFVHRATSRETFAVGALEAARWLSTQPPGLYDMQHVLGLKR
ncbi:MAG: 4-hydroxy-tetrahydrodipicolinate reductase [Kiritimatiellia bacterium]